ncbi:tail fiber protein [Xanthomonas phage FMYAK-P1]|uniref:Tail fiber protein n=1 Tax=Xanthomonas phage FMYAK-P1 TaxID=2886031 RepID=A0AAE8YM95_9CAUD|nr:tail fiber protein [Xanthomonas phage FMYAK-P1]UGL62745.1 tail fiber protein [Xanthomonas phage FMYAK-P1]
MAFATGTAANHVDALDKLRLFLTANESLVAAGQTWQQLRWVPDNLDSVDTTLPFSSGVSLHRMFRPDFRTQNFNDDASGQYLSSTSFTPDQYVRLKMRAARAVTRFTLKASQSSNVRNYTPRNFRLEYSDDGSAWSTALDVTEQRAWTANEERTFTVPSATGEHLWWRLVTKQTGDYGGTLTGSQWELRSLWLYDGSELVSSSESYLVVKGPGLAGDEEIFAAFRTSYNTGTGEYFMMVQGLTGYLPNEQSPHRQPGLHPSGWPVVPLWGASMPFWFVGSGRRVVFVFKVSTVFEAGYAGFFLPYASPQQYPYPLAIGGSMSPRSDSYRYDFVSAAHSAFPMPGSYTSTSGSEVAAFSTTLNVMLPDGSWFDLHNRPSSGGQSESYSRWSSSPGSVLPHGMFDGNNSSSSAGYGIRENVGGGFTVLPSTLFQRQPSGRFLGELDGCFQISGFQNGSENTGTIEGEDYVVFQNTYRTDVREYWALKAE